MKGLFYIGLLFLLCLPVVGRAQIITTVAGGGNSLADGIPATTANIHAPLGGAFDKYGNYYFACGNVGPFVYKVDAGGIITTIAGSSTGFSGDSGIATLAQFNFINGIAADTNANIYIADTYNRRIRKIDGITGFVTTYAGNGSPGSSGDSGLATSASLTPWNVCTDRSGNVFVLDSFYKIRKIDAAGIITTYAGTGIIGSSGDNGPAIAATIASSYGLCTDNVGNLYIGCYGKIRKINVNTGIITTIAGHGDNFYNGVENVVADSAAFDPYMIAVDFSNNIYIASLAERVFKIDHATNIFSTIVGIGIAGFSGDNGPADSAEIYNPAGVITDTCGDLYIADAANHRIRKVTFDSTCGHTSSVKNVANNTRITIYPNPANSILNIQANVKIETIELLNVLGQCLLSQTAGSEKVSVNVKGLPAGIYLLRINRQYTQRVRIE